MIRNVQGGLISLTQKKKRKKHQSATEVGFHLFLTRPAPSERQTFALASGFEHDFMIFKNAPDLLDFFLKVSIVVVRDHLRESDLLSGGLGEEKKGREL